MANYDGELIDVVEDIFIQGVLEPFLGDYRFTDGDFAAASQVQYVMRGYDSTLAKTVTWIHLGAEDRTGTAYHGPGPLISIVLTNIVPRILTG